MFETQKVRRDDKLRKVIVLKDVFKSKQIFNFKQTMSDKCISWTNSIPLLIYGIIGLLTFSRISTQISIVHELLFLTGNEQFTRCQYILIDSYINEPVSNDLKNKLAITREDSWQIHIKKSVTIFLFLFWKLIIWTNHTYVDSLQLIGLYFISFVNSKY